MKYFSLLVIGFVLLPTICFAIPAPSNFITATQPDGSHIRIKVNGDEKINWYENEEGYTLLRDANGYFVYACENADGDLVPSSHKYYSSATKLKPSKEHTAFLNSLPKHLFYSTAQVKASLKNWEFVDKLPNKPTDKLQEYTTRKQIKGNRKYLVVLMSYPDVPFTKTRDEFEALFNATNYKENGNEGSVRDYFLQNSYNTFTPEFVVVGPYEAVHEMEYYEYNGNNWPTSKAPELIKEAIGWADAEVDYAEFDNDGDSFVDAITVIYAGFGSHENVQGAIWPHASRLSSAPRVDGKYARSYCCSSELINPRSSNPGMAKIGTFCHEFNHTLGSPDYYDTDYGAQGYYNGLGSWCLMSSGNYNGNGGCPAPINAFQKWMFGWIEPQVLTNTAKTISNMPPTATNPVTYRINTELTDEFFILENKQRVGFDKGVPGHGLMIWHIHPTLATKLNSGNDGDVNATHPQLLYPVCASSKINIPTGAGEYGDINDADCLFPGPAGNRFFTNSSTPAAISWSGNMVTPLTNIIETDTFISFDYNVYTVPYQYDFTLSNHYQSYYQTSPTLPTVNWTRTEIVDNWLAELRSIRSTDNTPHEHYLFLPPLYLESKNIYHFRFDAKVYSGNYPGNAKIYLCSSNSINDQKELLFEFSYIPNTDFKMYEHDFEVTENKVYYIAVLTNTIGDVMDFYIDNIYIDQTVGIYETPGESIINCYPNPANNYVFIDNFSNEYIEKIDIVDINGRVLISKIYSNLASLPTENSSNNSMSIDISDLFAGNYYILMHTTSGNKKMKRLIKN